MTTDSLLQGLNDAQQRAVQHIDGPLLIVAGPGSGKTRVIVHRVAYLVHTVGVGPRGICVLTFTNKAARELRDRLARLLGGPIAEQITAGTFHALCSRILRESGEAINIDRGFTIYDRDDQVSLLKKAMVSAGIEPKQFTPGAILSGISGAKAQLMDPAVYRANVGSYFEEVTLRAYEEYQRMLRANQAVDFDDLLLMTYYLFASHPEVLERYQTRYRHLMVDEFQDTNVAQYEIAKQLAGRWRNIAVVGDPDQSIYSWRHADIRNILSFRNDFHDAETVLLEENYRSSANILSAAEKVISGNRQRVEKRLLPTAPAGLRVFVHEAYDEGDEALWVIKEVDRLRRAGELQFGDAAVAYRVNAQSRALEEACIRHGIPYRLVGALRFYQRKEIKDVIAYLRVLNNPADDVSLERILNVPPRGIGQRSVDELNRWSRTLNIPMRRALDILADDPEVDTPIPRAGKASLSRLGAVLKELQQAVTELEAAELLDLVLQPTGYRDHILSDDEQGEDRWDNIRELRTVAADFAGVPPPDGLAAFLEQVALVSDADNADSSDGVTLITLHQAKGLEFPAMFMVGMEEGMLPHIRSFDDPGEMEEERRLCYVGMTRAKERLYLTRAFRRRVMGNSLPGIPSRFLADIPRELIASPEGEREARQETRAATRTGSRARSNPFTLREIEEPAPYLIRGRTDGADTPTGPPPFDPGDRVSHATFGEGVVVNCKPTKDDYEVTVAFDGTGVKRLLHSLAKLEASG
ncbi:MAG: UvrD-helicase domain-containing protein [Chloroflexi bacterium]|nr:UvrD-helicase domain-containing protein [Chloroflexota bacterium]